MSLRRYRKLLAVSQGEVARWAGVSQGQISNIERGRRGRELTLGQARQIVDEFQRRGIECSLDDVFPPQDQEDCAA